MMKCIIVEDNRNDMELLQFYISQRPELQLAHSFINALDALSYINEFQPPVLFMDIDMPVLKGIDLYKKLSFNPVCIFVTAHSEYALESYETSAFDFILKPYTAERFNHSVDRLQEYFELKKRADLYDTLFEAQNILVREGTVTYRVPLNEIIYIEALNDYTKIITESRKYMTLSKLKHFLERLPAGDFVRIHRSYAVAKKFVQNIRANEVKIAGRELPIGKTFKTSLKAQLSFS